MISKVKRLEIANIAHAYVSGMFAMMTNEKYRGPNFTWEEFPFMMADMSRDWQYIHHVKSRSTKEEIDVLFAEYAREFSETLIKRMQ